MSPAPSKLLSATRVKIYALFLENGRAPSSAEVAAALGCEPAQAEQAYRELAAMKVITLDPAGRIRMAHPLSAVQTAFKVRAAAVEYWANCAWDALGIAAMLSCDTEAVASCPDCGEAVDLSVRGCAPCAGGIIHFMVPPERFWEDIAFT